mgnify:CR=1 FL=1
MAASRWRLESACNETDLWSRAARTPEGRAAHGRVAAREAYEASRAAVGSRGRAHPDATPPAASCTSRQRMPSPLLVPRVPPLACSLTGGLAAMRVVARLKPESVWQRNEARRWGSGVADRRRAASRRTHTLPRSRELCSSRHGPRAVSPAALRTVRAAFAYHEHALNPADNHALQWRRATHIDAARARFSRAPPRHDTSMDPPTPQQVSRRTRRRRRSHGGGTMRRHAARWKCERARPPYKHAMEPRPSAHGRSPIAVSPASHAGPRAYCHPSLGADVPAVIATWASAMMRARRPSW